MHAQRVLVLEGGRNFRDLGGYRAEDGRCVKWRRLFRSGSTNALTDADYQRLAGFGLKVMFDLRATAEREHAPTDWRKIPNGTYWARHYVQSLGNLEALLLSEVATSQEATATMVNIYRQLPIEQAPAYRELFRLLAEGELPLVFNCSAGKDRTGVAAALVLSALAVPWKVVIEDYVLSNETFNYSTTNSNQTQFRMAKKISAEVVRALGGTSPSYLDAAFSTISNSWGSIDMYLREELGVTPEMLRQIQANLLE